MTIALQRAPQHIMCVSLGLVGGTTGVALAIGLAIVVQLLLPPSTTISPGVIPLMVTAALAGLGASWLLGRLAYYVFPSLFSDSGEQGQQVMLVFSIFTSLLQILLFFARA